MSVALYSLVFAGKVEEGTTKSGKLLDFIRYEYYDNATLGLFFYSYRQSADFYDKLDLVHFADFEAGDKEPKKSGREEYCLARVS